MIQFLGITQLFKNTLVWNFLGGPVAENPPCNTVDLSSVPGWGTKIPHAEQQLSLQASTKTQGSQINTIYMYIYIYIVYNICVCVYIYIFIYTYTGNTTPGVAGMMCEMILMKYSSLEALYI